MEYYLIMELKQNKIGYIYNIKENLNKNLFKEFCILEDLNNEFLIKEFKINISNPIKIIIYCSGNSYNSLYKNEIDEFVKYLRNYKFEIIFKYFRNIDILFNFSENSMLKFKFYSIEPLEITELDKINKNLNVEKIFKEIKFDDKFIVINIKSSSSFNLLTKYDDKYVMRNLNRNIFGEITLTGLINFIYKDKYINIDSIIKDALEDGNNFNVDLTVGDIYGENCNIPNLPKNLIASSLGKQNYKDKKESLDFLKSIIIMIAINISHITSINVY